MSISHSVRVRIALGLAGLLTLAFGGVPAAGSAGFGDVPPGAYFEAPVQWMVDNGITLGTEPGCFSPHEPVTRGQAAAFMWRMEGEPSAPPHSFVDAGAAWLSGAVAWMSSEGITLGTTPTAFEPGAFVTRGQIAAFLHRLAGEPAAAAHTFDDITQPWQQAPVSWMSELGITNGIDERTFAPNDVVTRGQVAAFLYRYRGEPAVALDTSAPTCGGTGGTTPADDLFNGGPTNLLHGDDSAWSIRNGASASIIDIDRTTPGSLVIVPHQSHHNGWYGSSEGPYVYQEIEGDFAMAIRLSVLSVADSGAGAIPGPGYNSGGFVVRDPDAAHDWVMYNMGNQAPGFGYGREVKTTVGGVSVLNLYDQTATTHRLLVCRVGSQMRYFHGSSSGADWTEEVLFHDRPDFGATLEVGFVANAWQDGPQPWVEIHEVHFGTPGSVADCPSAVDPF